VSQHDFRVLRKYLAVETVQCSRCTMLYVRDAETKKPIPAQVQEFLLDAYPNCDEFSDLTTVTLVMET